jgi:ribosomal protein L34
MPVITKSGDNKFNILVKHSVIVYEQYSKMNWKYFHKTTCDKKSLCIFALGFRITDIQKRRHINKILKIQTMSKERFNHRKKRRNKHGFMDRMASANGRKVLEKKS